MELGDEVVHQVGCHAPASQMVAQALLAARHGKEASVALDVPPVGEAEPLERPVEGRPVAVALGLGDRPVDVEHDSPQPPGVSWAT